MVREGTPAAEADGRTPGIGRKKPGKDEARG